MSTAQAQSIEIIITPIRGVVADDTTVGYTGGVFRFGDAGVETNILYGVLKEKPLSTISTTSDVRRYGNYSSLNNVSVSLSNNFGLYTFLQENELLLEGSSIVVQLKILDFTSRDPEELFHGTITTISPDFDYLTIQAESISRTYKGPTTNLMDTGTNYKPLMIGKSNYDSVYFPDSIVKYSKGIPVDNGTTDVKTGSGKVWFYKATISEEDLIYMDPTNIGMTSQDAFDVSEIVNNASGDPTQPTPCLFGVSGNGEGTLIPILSMRNVTPGGVAFSVKLGVEDSEGVIIPGTMNRLPDGLVGTTVGLYDGFATTAGELGLDPSLIKIVMVDKYIQMDDWPNTQNSWNGHSFTWNTELGKYLMAPSFGSGTYNIQDRIKQVNPKGWSRLEDSPIASTNRPGESFPCFIAEPEDLEGFDGSFFPTELALYGYCFSSSLRSTNWVGGGWYIQDVGIVTPPTEVHDSLEDQGFMVDGTTLTEWNTTLLHDAGGEGMISAAWVLKLSMPQFDIQPDGISFCADIRFQPTQHTTNLQNTKRVVALVVNDMGGSDPSNWSVVDYQETKGLSDLTFEPIDPADDYQLIRNQLPENGGTASYFKYQLPNEDNGQIQSKLITHHEAIQLTITDDILNNQTEIFLMVGATGSYDVAEYDITVRDVGFVGTYEAELESLVVSYDGRADGDGASPDNNPIVTAGNLYSHVLKLQNYGARLVQKPGNGWGSAYPNITDTQWMDLINLAIQDESILNDDINVQGQKLLSTESNTEAMKKEVARLMWAWCGVDGFGVEQAYPMIPYLTDETSTLLNYQDTQGRIKFSPRRITDIFTAGVFHYGWDEGSGTYMGEVGINTVEAETFRDEYVVGMSDPTKAEQLWTMAHTLWVKYSIITDLPTEIGDVKLLVDEDSIFQYIENLYKWGGCRWDSVGGVWDVVGRYTGSVVIGLYEYITSGFYAGTGIRLQIPTISDSSEYHKGIITGTSINISEKSTVTLTTEMAGDVFKTLEILTEYHETGTASDTIEETGSQTNEIHETGVL